MGLGGANPMEEALEHRVKPSQKQLLAFKCQLNMQQPREKNILTSAALEKIRLFLIINPDPESWLYVQNEVIIMWRKKMHYNVCISKSII